MSNNKRDDKKYDVLNCHIPKDISEEMRKLCDETGLTKTAAIRRALCLYLDNYKKHGVS